MKLRDSFNSGVRKLGNEIYDSLGDKLTSDISLKNMARGSLTGILAVGAMLPLSGCLSTYGKSVVRNLGYTTMQQAAVSGVRNSVEGSRGTTVNVGGDNYGSKKRELVVQYWKDFNGNRKLDVGEVLGKVEESVNLDKYGLNIELVTSSSRAIMFYVLDSENNKISQSSQKKWRGGYTAAGHGDTNDWIDTLNNVSKTNPGEYTIYVQQDGHHEVFKQTINITRDSVESLCGIVSSVK